jgi:hypothetical protein
MDDLGIDRTVISLATPLVNYYLDPALATQAARLCNDGFAALVAAQIAAADGREDAGSSDLLLLGPADRLGHRDLQVPRAPLDLRVPPDRRDPPGRKDQADHKDHPVSCRRCRRLTKSKRTSCSLNSSTMRSRPFGLGTICSYCSRSHWSRRSQASSLPSPKRSIPLDPTSN